VSEFQLFRGRLPLLISQPHDGTELPTDIAERLLPSARRVPDTDWHISRLYGFAEAMGASILRPRYSRYVVDLNRPPDDVSLYPGQNTTGLCPLFGFDGAPIYAEGQQPTPDEIDQRVERYWRPYHDALAAELERLRTEHGAVLLWEAHSIRGECPFLFEGRLPDLNLGTASGASCSPPRQDALQRVLAAQPDYDWVVNGRFKGGYITRHYGRPEQSIDAVQLEISQRCYMDEDSFQYLPERARPLQQLLQRLLEGVL